MVELALMVVVRIIIAAEAYRRAIFVAEDLRSGFQFLRAWRRRRTTTTTTTSRASSAPVLLRVRAGHTISRGEVRRLDSRPHPNLPPRYRGTVFFSG